MKKVSLSGSPRADVGKKDATALRNNGRVPAVVYGGKEQTHFHVSQIEIGKLIINPEVYRIELNIDGKKIESIIKDVQQHPVTDKITHVDFMELDENRLVKVNIPIRTIGVAPGIINGGKLQKVFRKVQVLALPGDLPSEMEIDISGLKIGDSIRIGDLKAKGVKFLHDPKAVLVSVKTARGAVLDEEGNVESEDSASEGGEDKKEEAAAE